MKHLGGIVRRREERAVNRAARRSSGSWVMPDERRERVQCSFYFPHCLENVGNHRHNTSDESPREERVYKVTCMRLGSERARSSLKRDIPISRQLSADTFTRSRYAPLAWSAWRLPLPGLCSFPALVVPLLGNFPRTFAKTRALFTPARAQRESALDVESERETLHSTSVPLSNALANGLSIAPSIVAGAGARGKGKMIDPPRWARCGAIGCRTTSRASLGAPASLPI